jgi:hypothetical protein
MVQLIIALEDLRFILFPILRLKVIIFEIAGDLGSISPTIYAQQIPKAPKTQSSHQSFLLF